MGGTELNSSFQSQMLYNLSDSVLYYHSGHIKAQEPVPRKILHQGINELVTGITIVFSVLKFSFGLGFTYISRSYPNLITMSGVVPPYMTAGLTGWT